MQMVCVFVCSQSCISGRFTRALQGYSTGALVTSFIVVKLTNAGVTTYAFCCSNAFSLVNSLNQIYMSSFTCMCLDCTLITKSMHGHSVKSGGNPGDGRIYSDGYIGHPHGTMIQSWHWNSFRITGPWASCQIRKIASCACAGNAGNIPPRRRFQRKPLVSDPGMHHGTCDTHVPWCMSGSLNRGGGENVPGIPGACATRNFTYLERGPWSVWIRLMHRKRPHWFIKAAAYSIISVVKATPGNNVTTLPRASLPYPVHVKSHCPYNISKGHSTTITAHWMRSLVTYQFCGKMLHLAEDHR